MRKMYSENQIKDIVNKGIEDGSIHADPSTEVKVGDINSESATAGKVIIADGDGGAEWGSAGMEIVEISSSYQTLTDDEFAKASGNNCLLKYSGEFYHKDVETTSSISYYHINESFSSTYLKRGQLQITKSTKLCRYYDNNLIIANATLSGSETSLTSLQIANTNYKVGGSPVLAYEGTSLLPSGMSFTGWTLHRAIKDGNILWVVISGSISNTNSQSTILDLFSFTLPSDISAKIYRQDGTTCNQASSSDTNIVITQGLFQYAGIQLALVSPNANSFTFKFRTEMSIGENTTKYVECRLPIFLDIGA